MPKVVHDLAKKLQKKGMSESRSWAIAYSTMQKAGRVKRAAKHVAKRTKRRS
jgi:hypothetical protein